MIIRTAIKAGICYGAVWYTRQLGVWGTSDDTHKLFTEIQHNMEPVCQSVRSQIGYQPPAMPQSDLLK
uniref:MICOS complex subunit MIC13 n=1 Tax=Culicoides sonorensis TaxID=179676 RepID=A0A336MBN0_CULSO